jgi:hypothetical protein
MTNEAKLAAARQELNKLPATWRNIFTNHRAAVHLRDERLKALLYPEVLNRPGDPMQPNTSDFMATLAVSTENGMASRYAIPCVAVDIIESLPEFAEAVEAVAKVVDKIRKLEAAAAADREAFAKAEAALAAAEAEFILEAKERFEASKRETIEADPRFKALRDAAEAARAKVAAE